MSCHISDSACIAFAAAGCRAAIGEGAVFPVAPDISGAATWAGAVFPAFAVTSDAAVGVGVDDRALPAASGVASWTGAGLRQSAIRAVVQRCKGSGRKHWRAMSRKG